MGELSFKSAQASATTATDIDAFVAEPWALDTSITVKEKLANMIATIGENMNIRRFEKVVADNGIVVSYIHAGGKIGVVVNAETDSDSEEVKTALKDIAMQVAALNPKYTSRDEVDQDYIAHETEVLTAAAKKEKPDANDKIIDGMVKGRVSKQLKDICLLDQVFVKAADGKQSVDAFVKETAKNLGISLKVTGFVRFETGEGIEKKSEDFAAEVAAQMGQ